MKQRLPPSLSGIARTAWHWLGSLELTIALLAAMMVLVFFGTLHQVHLGTYLAQKQYFSSWLIHFHTPGGWRIPIFPGGYTVGGLWLLNLVAAHGVRARWEARRIGLLLTHAGLFLLILGQGLTQMLAVESQLAVEEGETKNYSESSRDVELAVIDTTDPREDTVYVIPASFLEGEGSVQHPGLPFEIIVKRFFPNARLGRGGASLATRGVGAGVAAAEVPRVTSDDERDNVSAFLEIRAGGKSLGVWLASLGLGAPQTFAFEAKTYRLALRPARYYYPFSLHLKDFKHDVYPGTDIPKNFSSLLRLNDPDTGEDRDVLIYMNHPLRYRGLTFYQASFGRGDRLSILQVVKNPVWVAPYLACLLVCLGLGWHFAIGLARFRRDHP